MAEAETVAPAEQPVAAPAPAAPPASPEERIAALMQPEPAPAEDAPERAAERTDDDATQDAQTDAPDENEATQPAQDGESGEPDAETLEIETIGELASHLGVDVADLYENLHIPVTNPDGTASQVTLGQYKDAYVSAERSAAAQRDLTQARESAEKEHADLTQNIKQRLTEAEGVLAHAEKQLLQDYQSIDWNTLRGEDPAEWTAKQREFDAKAGQLQTAKQQAVQNAQALMQEADEAAKQEHAQLLEREGAALLKAIPEWGDPAVADKGKAELKTYLQGQGLSESDIGQLIRHEHVVLARKAMLYDAQQSAAKAEVKRVIKLGKRTMKPGAKPNPNQAKSDAVAAAKVRARKSGNMADAAAAIAALR